eukprot:3404237-Pyramimonas_sp.AAC.1
MAETLWLDVLVDVVRQTPFRFDVLNPVTATCRLDTSSELMMAKCLCETVADERSTTDRRE